MRWGHWTLARGGSCGRWRVFDVGKEGRVELVVHMILVNVGE